MAVAVALVVGCLGGLTGVAAASSSSSSPVLTASFTTVSRWSGGYTGNFTVTNTGSSAANGWKLVFDLPAGGLIVGSWNGTVSESGPVVTVTNASYNAKLAPGASATFGFQASYSGAFSAPSDCTIDGAACSGGSVSTATGTTATSTGTTTTGTTSTGTTTTGTTTTGTTTTGTTTTGTTTTGTTTTGTPPAGVSSVMTVTDDWSSGYNANFVITNNSPQAISGWTLSFKLPSGITLADSWSGNASVSGSTVTVTNAAWNGSLAPGASGTFGAEFSGGDVVPSGCTINGSASRCTITPSSGTTTTGGGGTTTAGGGSSSGAPGTTPTCSTIPGNRDAVQFAPYADVTLYPEVNLANTACATGIHDFSIAFFTGDGCTPQLATSSYENPALQGDIANLRSIGGDAIGSFGGEAGQELADSCTNLSQLAQAYEDVINYYGFKQVDFDIEGAAMGDTAGLARRVQALQQVEQAETAAGHPFTVSLTLPVLPTGLPDWPSQNELGIVQQLAQVVPVTVVNIMTMDYGETWPSPATSPSTDQMGALAIQAAQATESELATIFPSDSAAQLWKMIGITPLIGVNDQADEVFTPADATQVADWALATGIGRLAFWSLTKDAECPGGANQGDANTCSSITQAPWQFSGIFEKA